MPGTRVVVSMLIVGLIGCGGAGAGPEVGAEVRLDSVAEVRVDSLEEVRRTRAPLVISGLTVVVNPGNVLSCFVVWSSDRPSTGVVTVDCGDYQATVAVEEPATDHEVLILGLYEGAACEVEVAGVAEDGAQGTEAAMVEAGALPDCLPELELAVEDDAAMQPGWTLFNLSATVEEHPPIVGVVDELGRYRWYHVRNTETSGSGMVVRRVDEGFLVGGGSDGGKTWPAVVDLAGRVVWEGDLPGEHHEVLPWDEGLLMHLSETASCANPEVKKSGVIAIHDVDTDQRVWEWSFCDHFDAPTDDDDWDHCNSLSPFPDGDAVLLSARDLYRVFKVDLQTGELVWSLGVFGDFDRTDGGMGAPFLRQHAAELIGPDRILLFNNGKKDVNQSSGAVEIAFDEDTMEYQVVWSWYPDPPILCKVWGDADRLDNGNTLITFGRRETLDSHLIEVTEAGERVWELVAPAGWGWYRSERIDALPAGLVLE